MPSSLPKVAKWKADFKEWCSRVSKKPADRSLFSRADQLYFDALGFVEPIAMTGNAELDHLLSQLKMKIERLRNVIDRADTRAGTVA